MSNIQPSAGLTTLKDHQLVLEQLFAKNQLMKRLRSEFTDCKDFNFVEYIGRAQIPTDFGIDVLAQMALRKRVDLPTLVGTLRHHFQAYLDASQRVADMLVKCVEAKLMAWDAGLEIFIVHFEITADVQLELDRFQYPLPMVVPPKKLVRNLQSAYLLGSNSVILKDNHHDDDVCLDHLNRMNAIEFTINANTAVMVKNQWSDLDKPKEGETHQDFERRVKAFEKYDRTAHDVMNVLTHHGNKFHLTHRYDKRGRIYAQGYHVNYQGTPWNKSVVEFANQETVQ